jgi:uncharacterized membrane protein YfcA
MAGELQHELADAVPSRYKPGHPGSRKLRGPFREELRMSWFIGLFAGVFGGLLGVGGGVIMIPLMVKTLQLGQHRAHGTSLVAVVFTGLSGALTYAWHGSLDWKAGLVLAVTAIITARSGPTLPERFPNGS